MSERRVERWQVEAERNVVEVREWASSCAKSERGLVRAERCKAGQVQLTSPRRKREVLSTSDCMSPN